MVELTVTKSVCHMASFNRKGIMLVYKNILQHHDSHDSTCTTFLDYVLSHWKSYHMEVFSMQKTSTWSFCQRIQIEACTLDRLTYGDDRSFPNDARFLVFAPRAVQWTTISITIFYCNRFSRTMVHYSGFDIYFCLGGPLVARLILYKLRRLCFSQFLEIRDVLRKPECFWRSFFDRYESTKDSVVRPNSV